MNHIIHKILHNTTKQPGLSFSLNNQRERGLELRICYGKTGTYTYRAIQNTTA